MQTTIIQNQRPKMIVNPDTGLAFTIFERLDASKDGAVIPVCVSFVTQDNAPANLPSWIEFVPSEKAAKGNVLIYSESGLLRNKDVKYLEYLSEKVCQRLRRSIDRDAIIATNGNKLRAITKSWREPYRGGIDLVMAVHGRADWLRHALNAISVSGGLEPNDRFIIVDDHSSSIVNCLLEGIAVRNRTNMIIIRNNKRSGYLHSINEGINVESSTGKKDLIVIMNSDVLVSPGWIAKIRRAFGNQNVGAASLISNNMVNLSLPMLPGSSYLRMNEMLEVVGKEECQDAILPTGAMLAFRRNLIEKYGLFDEKYYGEGYGEETDFLMWVRETEKKKVALIDTGYFYHSGGASYKDRSERERAGYNKFIQRWGNKFQALLQRTSKRDQMGEYKKVRDVFPPTNDRKIAFYLHALELSGGYHVIANVVNRMIRKGIDARIVTSKLYDHSNKMVELFCEPFCFKNEIDFVDRFTHEIFDKGLLVANVWFTAPWVKEISDKHKGIKPVYYLQDFDPWFAGKDKEQKVFDTYKMIDKKLCNAKWSADMIKARFPEMKIDVIPIGVDTKLFCPVDGWQKKKLKNSERGPIRILGFHRPVTTRRSSNELLALLHLLKNRYGKNIEVGVFGDKIEGTTIKERVELIKYYGRTRQHELAELMRDTDIFVDMSKFQGFGLTNLESMASGVAVVSTDNYGIREYGKDGENCRIIPVDDIPSAVEAISALIEDDEQRIKIANEGLKTARERYDWEIISDRMIDWFFSERQK